MTNRLFFALFTCFAVAMIFVGIKTGKAWVHYSPYGKATHPKMFWAGVVGWSVFACIAGLAAIPASRVR